MMLVGFLLQAAITVLGYGLWFYISQKMWANWSPGCTEGWNLVDLILFVCLMLYTLAYAVVLAIIAILGVCCFPCLVCLCKDLTV